MATCRRRELWARSCRSRCLQSGEGEHKAFLLTPDITPDNFLIVTWRKIPSPFMPCHHRSGEAAFRGLCKKSACFCSPILKTSFVVANITWVRCKYAFIPYVCPNVKQYCLRSEDKFPQKGSGRRGVISFLVLPGKCDTHSMVYKGHLYKGHMENFWDIRGHIILTVEKLRDTIAHICKKVYLLYGQGSREYLPNNNMLFVIIVLCN